MCEMRIVELYNFIWVQLDNNELTYFIPNVDTVTVVCRNREPVELPIMGVGKLSLSSGCKAYSKSTILQAHC